MGGLVGGFIPFAGGSGGRAAGCEGGGGWVRDPNTSSEDC